MTTWLLADAAAQSTAPSGITNSQTTVVLQSTAGFPATGYGQLPVTILDAGNGAYNANNPLATPYEYAYVTANNQGTNTLTWTRGRAGTSGTPFSAGAIVAAGFLKEVMDANTGAFARIDAKAGVLQLGGLGNVTGPPTTGTWATGDEWDDVNGTKWVCTSAGTQGTWKTAISLYRARASSAAGTVVNSGFAKITLGTKTYDPNTNFDATTNYRYTCPVAGYYQVIGKVGYPSGPSSGLILALIYKNGTEVCRGGGTGTISGPVTSDIISCAATDYLELWGYSSVNNTSGGAVSDNSYLAIAFLGSS